MEISIEELYKELNTSINGLTEEEAHIRLEKYGENKLTERKKKSNFIIFISLTFTSICIIACNSIFSY